MTQIVERTILFADLRGSTALFETLGNAEATAVVTQSVALPGAHRRSPGGRVVKTLGDGLMAIFEKPRAAARPPTRCTSRCDEPSRGRRRSGRRRRACRR